MTLKPRGDVQTSACDVLLLAVALVVAIHYHVQWHDIGGKHSAWGNQKSLLLDDWPQNAIYASSADSFIWMTQRPIKLQARHLYQSIISLVHIIVIFKTYTTLRSSC
jgi:hypothetical protein